jgi:hypothetical protein
MPPGKSGINPRFASAPAPNNRPATLPTNSATVDTMMIYTRWVCMNRKKGVRDKRPLRSQFGSEEQSRPEGVVPREPETKAATGRPRRKGEPLELPPNTSSLTSSRAGARHPRVIGARQPSCRSEVRLVRRQRDAADHGVADLGVKKTTIRQLADGTTRIAR